MNRLAIDRPWVSRGARGQWLVCSLPGLALFLGLWIGVERATETRELAAGYSPAQFGTSRAAALR